MYVEIGGSAVNTCLVAYPIAFHSFIDFFKVLVADFNRTGYLNKIILRIMLLIIQHTVLHFKLCIHLAYYVDILDDMVSIVLQSSY